MVFLKEFWIEIDFDAFFQILVALPYSQITFLVWELIAKVLSQS